jgi:quercetin 2,3-dioxygenase
MSAGRGVQHSEFNHAPGQTTHFLQIWIEPSERGIAPGYEQKHFDDASKRGVLRLVASPDGRDGSVTVHQDVLLLRGRLDPGATLRHDLSPGRHAWLQVTHGSLALSGGPTLSAGDGAAVSDEASLTLQADGGAEVLLFDLA